MLKRGDLVIDRESRDYQPSNVFLLIKNEDGNMWWVYDMGYLNHKTGWHRELLILQELHPEYLVKLTVDQLNKDKQQAYYEFKKQYIDTDRV